MLNAKEDTHTCQKKRLREALSYLKSMGVSQKQICLDTDISEADLSHYKKDNGKIKVIPNSFLNKLQKNHDINPEYIRGSSDVLLDNRGIEYTNFEKFVSDWEVVKSKNDSYLYVKMDENFYNFLIELDDYRKIEEKGIIKINEEISNLKKIYSGKPNIKEYVILPRNNFFEIVNDTVSKSKHLKELINFLDHNEILNDE